MSNPFFTRAMVAEAAVSANRIVKFGSADGLVTPAAAATDLLMGVVENVAPNAGERCEVVLEGIAEVALGGTVTRGQQLTSDASGRAVVGSAGNRRLGMAMVSGVSGDVIEVLLAPGTI